MADDERPGGSRLRVRCTAVMLRRKALPPELSAAHEAFAAQAQRVEAARLALLSCLPDGRGRARAPLEVGIDLLADEIDAVRPLMEAWRVAAVEEAWADCASAMDYARSRVDRARRVVGATDELHDLVAEVAALVQPLEAWADAEERWRALRRRLPR